MEVPLTTVGIFIAGYNTLNPSALLKILSKSNGRFRFELGVRIQTMGDPDLAGFAYSDVAFTSMISRYRECYDICVLLTSAPLEDNFFTRTIQQNTIIATSHQADELLEKSGRSLAEYYALAICQELISFAFQRATGLPWTELFHGETRGCLFDFAKYKPHKIAKLTKCIISPQTQGFLAEKNVDDRVISYVLSVLRRIRRPSFIRAIKESVMSPILSFFYGGLVIGFVVNVFSSLVLNKNSLSGGQIRFILFLGACIPTFPVFVFIWAWITYLRHRLAESYS